MNDLADFFVTGGTLRPQAPSYVTRHADQELFDHVLAGDFCYVLTARQMGKSSLMVRTTRRLKEAGVATATIDLTGIGDTQADTWYISLLTRIKKGLQLSVDVAVWWRERADLGTPQRFTEFLRDIALEECAGPIAIFVDEIDSTLSLNFRDDFFAAIRAIYNARASDAAYNRLTFVLLGVATPTDLIRDRQRTPFNIGRRIALQEFDATDARPLQQGLEAIHPGQSGTILARIFYWTNGHPYLTQKLCSAAAQADRAEWFEHDVDALVETSFLTKEARKESNLQFVQDRIRSSPPEERRRMLKLYRQLYAAKTVPDDDRSPIQNHLELSGLVGVAAGKLRIRNRIYQRVFDQNWIADNTPANTQLRVTVAASLFTLLLVAFIIYRTLNPVTQATAEASVCIDNFKKNTAVPARREALACLFDRPEYTETALQLFYNEMGAYDQKNLFLSSIPGISTNPQLDRQTVTVIKGVYATLDDEMSNDLDLMGAMLNVLNVSQQSEATDLKAQITNWGDGRRSAANGRYQEAIDRYTIAINVNNTNDDRNTGAHYDRAIALIKLRKYAQALEDLNQMIVIAKAAPSTPTPVATSITVTGAPPASSAVGTPTGTVLPTAVPTITATSVITPTPQAGASTSRFTSTELIIKTVDDTIRGNEELLSYLRDPQNQTTANQDLMETLGLSTVLTQPMAGCIVTIANTLVALMSEPSRFSQQLVKVRPGEYTMLEYKVVKFGSQDQGWFQIAAEGRTGWIADDTWTIDSKTSTCP
jgi:tetratricopeptide (TPR) repeat protein